MDDGVSGLNLYLIILLRELPRPSLYAVERVFSHLPVANITDHNLQLQL